MRLLLPFLLCLALPATAQNLGQWYHGNTEFRQNAAWAQGRSMQGGVDTLTIDCGPRGAYFHFEPVRALAESREDDVYFNFSGQSLRLAARYDARADQPGWVGPLTAELAERLSRSVSMTVGADRNGLTEFGLRGSRAAISKVLAECGPGRVAAMQAELGRPVIFARIRQACEGTWTGEPGAILESDLDGDGTYDYVLRWGMIECTAAQYAGPRRGAGFCGAQMCSADIYVSSVWRPESFPQGILNVGLEVWPEGGSHPIRTQSVNRDCEGGICNHDWRWTGSAFEVVR